MNKMVVIVLVLCIIGGAMSYIYIFSKKTDIISNQAVLVYKYEGKNINTKLTNQESMILKKILNHKRMYSDNPSCGFDKDISIRFDGQIFELACDDDPIIKDEKSGKYLSISDSEREKIDKIISKYGATFPAI